MFCCILYIWMIHAMCLIFCCSYLEVHENNPDIDRNETLGKFIESRQYSELFQKAYLVSYVNWSFFESLN